MPLTDTECRKAEPREKPFKLADGGGLYMEVMPTGSRYWRLKYRFDGKERRLAFGVYPDVTLKDARGKRDEARKLLAAGVDPGAAKKAAKQARTEAVANSFEAIAREWFAKFSPKWVKSNSDKVMGRLENDVFPWLGSRPIAEIKAPELLQTLRRIEGRGAIDTAHRVRQCCGQIFRYAVATGRAERDPSADLRGALAPIVEGHFPAITDPKQVGELLRAIHGYQGTLPVAAALRLAPMVFVRPGELRTALWQDIDLDAGEWRYTVSKTGTEHIVPLATQAVEILRDLHPLTGRSPYVFPGARTNGRPMSDNAILAALRRLSIPKEQMTGHGFRATARTILDEVLGFPIHIIEHQLAHTVKDPLGRAYNRTAHLPQRKQMMQAWADYLDRLRSGAAVVEFGERRQRQ